ncbi:protein CpxP [Ereboglobus sp. PH5-5]|nr:protein CpxP [Ereboglobus sp. PH5-5]
MMPPGTFCRLKKQHTMKSFKYVIVSLVLALGFAAPAMFAQDAGPKGKQGQRGDMNAALLKDITLTADQKTKVDAIRAEARKQTQALPKEERRSAKGRKIMQDANGKIREVLTPEQQKTFDANQKAMQERRGGGKNRDKGARPKSAK